MSVDNIKNQILALWNEHMASVRTETDESGLLINHIDDRRKDAIEVLRIIIHNFHKGDFDLQEFKVALDSYNKHNNLWGFTAKLGQLYFNQLIKAHEKSLDKLSETLKELITEPKNTKEALSKIDTLEKLTLSVYTKAKDKHTAPYPGAVGFFLSYFWQISNPEKWPVLYNTLINSFRELDIWQERQLQKDIYEHYLHVYGEIKSMVETAEGRKVSYWELEHALWNYRPKPQAVSAQTPQVKESTVSAVETITVQAAVTASVPETETASGSKEALAFREYLMPRLSRLLDREAGIGEDEYASRVTEAFAQMDFEVTMPAQGAERDARAVLRFREENVAFILDTAEGFDVFRKTCDRRIVKDYVNTHCTALRKEGFKRIAYLLVSENWEAGEAQSFISYLNWNTEVKRSILISSEALLYMLAHKLKYRKSLLSMTEQMSQFSDLVSSGTIAAELSK